MQLVKKVLLAQDFSESSKNIVKNVITLSKIFHSEVHLLHVLPDDTTNEKVAALLKEAATEKLEQTAASIQGEGVEVAPPLLKFGVPCDRIVEAAVRINASLIMVGAGSNEKDKRDELGSTAKHIIQKSEKPVLVVKEGSAPVFNTILCPVDFSLTSKRALKNAITMAHRFESELVVISVCEAQGMSSLLSEEVQSSEFSSKCSKHEKNFEEFLKDFNFAGLKWSKAIRIGKPAEEILRSVETYKANLLVIGTTGRTGLSRLIIGSVAEKVIREVPCSFISLKSEDIITLELEAEIRDIENHYQTAIQLMKDGFFEESIAQFKAGLSISSMHVPSYYGLARVYEKLDMPEKGKIYRESGKEIQARMWSKKIEEEVRKLRSQ